MHLILFVVLLESDDEDDTYNNKKGSIPIKMSAEDAESILKRNKHRINAAKNAQFLAPLDELSNFTFCLQSLFVL